MGTARGGHPLTLGLRHNQLVSSNGQALREVSKERLRGRAIGTPGATCEREAVVADVGADKPPRTQSPKASKYAMTITSGSVRFAS